MSDFIIRGDIHDEEKEAMLKAGLPESTYTRKVILDPTLAMYFQSLFARCLEFIPPKEYGLRNEIESTLKIRYDQL